MSQRLEFVILAPQGGIALKELCRRFGISRKTFYKWLKRYEASGGDEMSLVDRPRTPHSNRMRTSDDVRCRIIELRAQTGFGVRRLGTRLRAENIDVSAGTIWKIIARHEKASGGKPLAAAG